MHVLLVTQMVTFGSVDQGPIYKSDLWSFISETPKCCPSYLSVGIRLFQDSPGRFRGYGYLLRVGLMMMMMMYLSSVYFGTLELDLWLYFPSDGCDRFRDQASEQQMIRWLGGWQCTAFTHQHHSHFAFICIEPTCQPVHIACLLRYPAGGNKSKLMDPPNADILELKEMVRDLFSVVQGLALGQKAMAERLERIEGWMIKEKVQGKAPSSEVTNPSGSVAKKPSGNGHLEKEVESGGVQAKRERGKDRYHPYADTVTIPTSNQSAQQRQPPPQQRTQRAVGQVRRRTTDRHFNKPPVTYASLFKKLKDLGLVQPRMLTLLKPDQRPASYDENVRCEFHVGAPGHHIEDCKALKHVVQDLVDSKAINFAPSPNVNANPMPAHGQAMVSAIAEDSDHAYTVGEETDSDCEFDGWIKPCVPGMEVQNWKA
ncbi:hypothetical protein KIW84_013680 [Lathyrus oleraceus]|uniref:Uncharacterized protein n=1 Tax=Pisum sativum TaxID=3888 RepID=A0A9D5BKU8_PEA|nr:hypothetical protein KIW84_013680 [Pisum sativum]